MTWWKIPLRVWSAQVSPTSSSLNKSVPKHTPQNQLWPLVKENIGLSSSKVVREGESLGSCFLHKPFSGSTQSSAPLESLARCGRPNRGTEGRARVSVRFCVNSSLEEFVFLGCELTTLHWFILCVCTIYRGGCFFALRAYIWVCCCAGYLPGLRLSHKKALCCL